MKKAAVVFGGQGAHKKGMGMSLLQQRDTPAAKAWQSAETRLREAYGVSITSAIRDNLPFMDGVRLPVVDGAAMSEAPLAPASIRHEKGIMNLTYITQPAMLTAEVAALKNWEATVANGALVDGAGGVSHVAGHSLGEFSALCALNLLPIDVAAELVFFRGLLMDHAVRMGAETTGGAIGTQRHAFRESSQTHVMAAVNPQRAKLDNPADTLRVFVELIGQALSSTRHSLEISGCNVAEEQFTVAGTAVAMTILGKCLDPQLRAQALAKDGVESAMDLVLWAMDNVIQDQSDGVPTDPNKPIPKPRVLGALLQRRGLENQHQTPSVSMDGGLTLPEEHLAHLTHIADGRSGLKKKSWFVPLNVDVPFHTSVLYRAMDGLAPLLSQALPSAELIESRFAHSKVQWVTNVTGTPFSTDSAFRDEIQQTLSGSNVGETRHAGKYEPKELERLIWGATKGDVKELLVATMAAQIVRPVLWAETMSTVLGSGVSQVIEFSPDPVLGNMFKRAVVQRGGVDGMSIECVADMRPHLAEKVVTTHRDNTL